MVTDIINLSVLSLSRAFTYIKALDKDKTERLIISVTTYRNSAKTRLSSPEIEQNKIKAVDFQVFQDF